MKDSFVLAHGFPNKPVMDADFGDECSVICGAGIDLEDFNELVFDDEFLAWVREYCAHHQCNQVVVSLRGYPTGFCLFTTDERLEPI